MPIINFSTHHFTLLIGHMLSDTVFCRDCCDNIQPDWFTQHDVGGEFWHSAAFMNIKQYWDDYGTLMDPASFMIGLQAIAGRFITPGDPYHQVFQQKTFDFYNFMMSVTPTSLPLAREVYRWLLNKCKFDAEANSLIASGVVSLGDLAQKLSDVEKRRSALMGGISQQGLLSKQEHKPRTKTGVDFIDKRFGEGRGPCMGTVMGLIIPRGCGKTTLGNQISVSQALMGRPALIVIGEQGFDMDYQRNIWAVATGIPTIVFEVFDDDITKAARHVGVDPDMIWERLKIVDKNLRWVDLIKNDGDVESFENEIIRLAETSTDKPLEVVYIDWATAIANMMLSRGYRGRRFKDIREAIGVLSDRVAEIASRHELFIAISQQMCGQAAMKNPYTEHDHYCALDNKMFTAPFRYCMVVGKQCPKTKLQIAGVPKARNDQPYIGNDRWVLELQGPLARFREVEDYAVKPGRIVSIKHKDRSVVPGS